LNTNSDRLTTLLEQCQIDISETRKAESIISTINNELSLQQKEYCKIDLQSILCALYNRYKDVDTDEIEEEDIKSLVRLHKSFSDEIVYNNVTVKHQSENVCNVTENSRLIHYVDDIETKTFSAPADYISVTISGRNAQLGERTMTYSGSWSFNEDLQRITISTNLVMSDTIETALRSSLTLSITSPNIASRIGAEKQGFDSMPYLVEGGMLHNNIAIIHIFLHNNGAGAINQLEYIRDRLFRYEETILKQINNRNKLMPLVVRLLPPFGRRFPTNLISNFIQTQTDRDWETIYHECTLVG
jgi:hypothetical protein